MARREAGVEEEPTVADAFGLLGHETRLAIVETLADARRIGWQSRGLTFSELRKAVGVRDAGKFNYHLDALVDTFVVKRDGEYVLTNAGFELEGTVRERLLAESIESRTGTVDRDCPRCTNPIEVTYEDEHLSLACPEHGDLLVTGPPPAAVRGRELAEVVRLGIVHARQAVETARNGACPHCWGRMSVSAPPDDHSAVIEAMGREPSDPEIQQALAEFECAGCGLIFWLPVAACIGTHPAVVSYYHERDADPGDAWIFGLDLVTGANGTVVSEEPTRIEVVVTAHGADEGLVVTLDGETEVVSVDRVADVEPPRPNGD